MKIFCIVLISFYSLFAISQEAKINISYSEQLAVYTFIENLSSYYPPNSFKTEFNNSTYSKSEKHTQLLKNFEALNLSYSYEFQEYPYGTKQQMQTDYLIRKNLIETNNLFDFKMRCLGLLPQSTLNELCTILKEFTPIYSTLIYNPNKKQFEKQLSDIKKFTNHNNLQQFFDLGIQFYNAQWDKEIPFVIVFYPLPNSQSFSAYAFNHHAVCALQTHINSYDHIFSVMLHELFHLIYNEESLEFKTTISQTFINNSSKNSTYAFCLFDEVLATCLGNGYVHEKLTSKKDTTSWYNHVYIDLLSKKTYPLVLDYIQNKKPIDKQFIDAYIKIYDDNFPTWRNELEHIMAFRYVISEDQSDFNEVRQKYWYRTDETLETELSIATILKMKQKPTTKMIIVSKNHEQNLELIKSQFNELKTWRYDANEEFTFMIFLEDKTQLIVINKLNSTLNTMLENLKKK